MRFDVSTLEELILAMHKYNAADKKETVILVLHTPGQIAFRFLMNKHGIERQE